jgi:hypothetical protein
MGNGWAILAISDLQIPFEHKDALEFCQHIVKTHIPKNYDVYVVNLGDEVDQATLSIKHIPSPDGMSGGHELEEARHRLRDWYRAFPKMHLCQSNHTWRVFKKAAASGIPSEFMKEIAQVYDAPIGWKWAEKWIFNGILFEHGENVSGPLAAIRAAIDNRMNTVIGHQHSNGGIVYRGSVNGNLWGMNTGCLIDIDAYAFSYGRTLRNKPTLGCGLILNGVPQFIPMELNSKKRWIGRTI